jgi:hypothetical protein
MSTTVTAYEANDGTLFLTEEAAEEYEKDLAKKVKVTLFLQSPQNTLAAIGRTERRSERTLLEFIMAWETWRKAN